MAASLAAVASTAGDEGEAAGCEARVVCWSHQPATSLFALSVERRILGGNLIYLVILAIGVLGGLHGLVLREPKPSKPATFATIPEVDEEEN